MYDTVDFVGLWAAVAANPHDRHLQDVLADCLRDQGADETRATEAYPVRRISPLDIWSFGSGRGIGRGIGSGSGRGIGIGSGRGIGRGSGRGIGIGSGSGIGIGRGRGRGIGSGSAEPYGITQMRIGQAYLVHCGDWHTFVGRVSAQLGPQTYELESASKVAETHGGDNWHLLAEGDERARAACDYRHHKTRLVIPLAIAAFEWSGALPQEAETAKAGRKVK
jgi:hypothetical protein